MQHESACSAVDSRKIGLKDPTMPDIAPEGALHGFRETHFRSRTERPQRRKQHHVESRPRSAAMARSKFRILPIKSGESKR
jgi:hypothetical protein